MSRRTDELQKDINITREQLDDILDALQKKLSPSELIEEAMAYISKYPEEAGRYVSHTVREHPISMTITGIGLGLLAFAAARGFSRNDQRSPSYGPPYGYRSGATTFGQPVGGPARNDAFGRAEDFDTQGDIYPDIRGGGGPRNARRRTRGYADTAREYAHTARGYADSAAEQGHDYYDQARHGVERGYRYARDGVRQGYREARHYAGDAAHYAGRRVREAGSSAEHFVREEPLLIGAIGLAVGAILGAALPMTRRENRAIGRESDAFRERVKDAAREGYHRAEHVAEATYDTAKGEAKRQGFSSEGAKAAAENIEKRTAEVYGAAMDTAKKEAKQETSDVRSSASASSSTTSGNGSAKGV